MAKDLRDLLGILNIPYKDINLYKQAVTHPSFINETKIDQPSYQRLEFVGDAIIQFLVTEYIYHNYEYMDEGDMTLFRSNLVREESLANAARYIGLGDYILLGVGEEKSRGNERTALLADVYEALFAAVYLDCGVDVTRSLLTYQLRSMVAKEGLESYLELKDNKTRLQELVQADRKRSLEYVVRSISGPSNNPTFEVDVLMDGVTLGNGTGSNKKAAEQSAAKDALSKMAR
jgi:ribonuclease-3